MKVRELIELLQQVDPERVVVLSRDSEGNGYAVLSAVETMAFLPDGSYGEVYLEELTPELEAQGYSEEDVREDGEPALVLWP